MSLKSPEVYFSESNNKMVRELEKLVSIDTLLLFFHILIFTWKCSYQMWHLALTVKYHICYSVQISLFPRPVGRSMFTDGSYDLQVSVGGGQDNLTCTSRSESTSVRTSSSSLGRCTFWIKHLHCIRTTWSRTFQLIFKYSCKLLMFNSDNYKLHGEGMGVGAYLIFWYPITLVRPVKSKPKRA